MMNMQFDASGLTCPQCGAALSMGETCQDRFNQGQLLEINQPERYAVHHLSVPCYMLQHNVYTREGWLQARELLRRFVEDNLTPDTARRQAHRHVDSGKRAFSFTRGAKLPGVENIHWTWTVDRIRLDSAEHYCEDVRVWARAVLADSETLTRSAAADETTE